jgi:hypothetical protein
VTHPPHSTFLVNLPRTHSNATPTGFVIELSQPVAGVFGTCLLPTVLSLQTLSGTGLGGAASAVGGKLKQAGSDRTTQTTFNTDASTPSSIVAFGDVFA